MAIRFTSRTLFSSPSVKKSPNRPINWAPLSGRGLKVKSFRHDPAGRYANPTKSQRDGDVNAADTGESVALGRVRKRDGWESQRGFTPDTFT